MLLKSKSHWSKSLLVALGLAVIGVTAGFGSYIGSQVASNPAGMQMPPLELKAGSASRTDSMSMATGLIDGNVEALFVLDHLTGNLQCWMLSPRTGAVGAIYQTNVMADLGGGKQGKPELMMVTGNFFWGGGVGGNNLPGQSICYVGDAVTGNVVGYGVIYNKQAIKRGNFQGGKLQLVCAGKARAAGSTEREQ